MEKTSTTGVPMDHLCRRFSQVQQANRACDLALQDKLDHLKKEYFRNLRKSTDRIWRLQGADTPPSMRIKSSQSVQQQRRSSSLQDYKLPSAYNLKSLEKELAEVEVGEGDIRRRISEVRKQRHSLPARPYTAIPVRYKPNDFETPNVGNQTALSTKRMLFYRQFDDDKTLTENTLSEDTTELDSTQHMRINKTAPRRYRRKTWSAGEHNNLPTLDSQECTRTGPAKSNICTDKLWQINNTKSAPDGGYHNYVHTTKDTERTEHINLAESVPDAVQNNANSHEQEIGRQHLVTIIEDMKTSFTNLQGEKSSAIKESKETSLRRSKMVRSKTTSALLTPSFKEEDVMSKKRSRTTSFSSMSTSHHDLPRPVTYRSPWERLSRDANRRTSTSQMTTHPRFPNTQRSRKSGIFAYVNRTGGDNKSMGKQAGLSQTEATSSLSQLQNCRYLRRSSKDEETL